MKMNYKGTKLDKKQIEKHIKIHIISKNISKYIYSVERRGREVAGRILSKEYKTNLCSATYHIWYKVFVTLQKSRNSKNREIQKICKDVRV